MDNIIKMQNIQKEYGTSVKTLVLKGIDLAIEKGEFVSIIGPSGSGKSTLLNIIGTLDSPTSGKYIFDGTDISDFNRKQLAYFRNSKIGFVFQYHHLLPEFTALENILIPYNISRLPLTREVKLKAEELLEFVGLVERKNDKTNNLSGGQQQRIAIARALMNRPALVLADEPTGNLDSESTEQVYALLRKLKKELKTTFIIVTHDKDIASRCDREIKIYDGNVKV
jgi:lipoprotein-releasing system ATP-binding protein